MIRISAQKVFVVGLLLGPACGGCSQESTPSAASGSSTAPPTMVQSSVAPARIDTTGNISDTSTEPLRHTATTATSTNVATEADASTDSSKTTADPAVRPAAAHAEAAVKHVPLHPRTPADYAKAAAAAVERNGPIFYQWPAPRYALVFTGDLTGYIEPCGCSGLENLKGGLSRRHTLLLKLQQDGWPTATFDLGGQVRRVGAQQTEIKFQHTVKGLVEIGYAAIGLGADDLRMPAATLLGAATEPYLEKTAPFTSANVGLFAFDSGATARYRIVSIAGKKLGVTAVLGETLRQTINNDGIVSVPAEQALAEVLPKLAAEQCDVLILLSYASPAETEALVRRFPQFQFAVTAGGADEPPGDLHVVEGTKTGLIEVGKKGQHAIVLGIYDDAKQPVRYQRVPLDARFPESPAMRRLLAEYQDQLRVAGRENLGITEKIHPRADQANPLAAKFAGSASCARCHASAFEVWKDSGHAHATDTLVELTPPRHFDAECLSCHAVGWDPQQYVPFQSGFVDLIKTPQLAGNGCENCHGPGAAHVQAETAADTKFREQMRSLMHVSLDTVERNACLKCHDHDNSPAFKFDDYWSKIAH